MNNPVCHICAGGRAKLFMQKESCDFYRCPDCGLEFIFPQPDDTALKKIYSENYYDAWGLNVDSHTAEKSKRATFEYRMNLIRNNLKEGDAILDCGCATGIFLDLVKEEGYVPFGVEISEYGVSECRKKFGEQNIFHGQFEDAHFGNEKENFFTAIFMTDYLEHVRNPRRILQTAFRFLKPGGVLVITTPDTSSFSHWLMNRSWIHYKSEHLFYLSISNLGRLLSEEKLKLMIHKKGWKYFTADYVNHQFRTYHHPVFTPLSNLLNKITPRALSKKMFRFHAGEMIVVAGKFQSENE